MWGVRPSHIIGFFLLKLFKDYWIAFIVLGFPHIYSVSLHRQSTKFPVETNSRGTNSLAETKISTDLHKQCTNNHISPPICKNNALRNYMSPQTMHLVTMSPQTMHLATICPHRSPKTLHPETICQNLIQIIQTRSNANTKYGLNQFSTQISNYIPGYGIWDEVPSSLPQHLSLPNNSQRIPKINWFSFRPLLGTEPEPLSHPVCHYYFVFLQVNVPVDSVMPGSPLVVPPLVFFFLQVNVAVDSVMSGPLTFGPILHSDTCLCQWIVVSFHKG